LSGKYKYFLAFVETEGERKKRREGDSKKERALCLHNYGEKK
jgi:hypothetical protein